VTLPGILQRMFGCRHRHLSRVFTIKQRTYRVCFDCGREFDLPAAHAPKPLNSPPGAGPKMGPNYGHAG
jgi:hypothetical protein